MDKAPTETIDLYRELSDGSEITLECKVTLHREGAEIWEHGHDLTIHEQETLELLAADYHVDYWSGYGEDR